MKLKEFLDLKDEELTLNYLFNHFRNYVLVASICSTGIYLTHHNSSFSGFFLIILSLILLTLNLLPIILLFKKKFKLIWYLLFSFLMTYSIIQLFDVLISTKVL